jgi:hypothetical protein
VMLIGKEPPESSIWSRWRRSPWTAKTVTVSLPALTAYSSPCRLSYGVDPVAAEGAVGGPVVGDDRVSVRVVGLHEHRARARLVLPVALELGPALRGVAGLGGVSGGGRGEESGAGEGGGPETGSAAEGTATGTADGGHGR